MNKKTFFIILIILAIITTIGYSIDEKTETSEKKNLTGELATLSLNPDAEIRTIAICNESNFCQDYKITCSEGMEINREAIENAVIQHPEDWTDPRNIDYNNLCE